MQKKNLIVSPFTLKGKEALEYTKLLMNINESDGSKVFTKSDDIKLIKKAHNGQVFGLIKEKQEYVIKVLKENANDLSLNNFDYIGGLSNKRDFVYDTYTKAINNLNIHLHELAYSMGYNNVKINLLENDIISFEKPLIKETFEDNEPIVVELDEHELMMESLLNKLKDDNYLMVEESEGKEEIDESFELSDLFKELIKEGIVDVADVNLSFNKNKVIVNEATLYEVNKEDSILSVIEAVTSELKKKV